MTQKTIEKAVSCSGIGLHSGKKVAMTFLPASVGSGVIFAVKSGSGRRLIQATPDKVHETRLATGILDQDCSVGTIEHVMAALRGLGIDNIQIELDGCEVPIMDGSASPFTYLLQQAGIVEQHVAKRVYMLRKPLRFSQDGKWIKARPSNGLQVRFTIDYEHPLLGEQERSFSLEPTLFAEQISKARTFAFLSDVEQMRGTGLALGGSLDNALVLDEAHVLNQDGMRYPDEPVRHKILDFIGDIALMPYPLLGDFEVYCSGHEMNNKFCRFLLEQAEDYLLCCEYPEERKGGFQPLPTGEFVHASTGVKAD